MTGTRLDDARWMSPRLLIERIPNACKRNEAGLRRFVEAVLWILPTGAPWRDLADDEGHWRSVYHRKLHGCTDSRDRMLMPRSTVATHLDKTAGRIARFVVRAGDSDARLPVLIDLRSLSGMQAFDIAVGESDPNWVSSPGATTHACDESEMEAGIPT